MDESLLDEHMFEESKEEIIDFDSFDIVAFTDGSCIGKKIKSAGSGVYFHSKSTELNQIKILEKMPSSEILYLDLCNKIIYSGDEINFDRFCSEEDCVSIGYASAGTGLACSKHKREGSKVVATYVRYSPTNIRAEGNAILLAINAVANFFKGESKTKRQDMIGTTITSLQIENLAARNYSMLIVTDSKFWVAAIQSWIPSWIQNRKLMEHKNVDIIAKLISSKNELARLGVHLELAHVYGHQDSKKKDLSFQEKGNVLADKLATHASSMGKFGIFTTK